MSAVEKIHMFNDLRAMLKELILTERNFQSDASIREKRMFFVF